ncbi:MAG: class I SAM-dependent methyltransferase [Promethearchaeota archaeon]
MVRAKNFDIAIKKFIIGHPSATVVNIGARLDTTFYRVDNGKIKWYELDLPSAISFRKRFLSESERNKFISKSALDIAWFDEIEFNKNNGIFFIAGGFVYYFKEEEISALVIKMAKRFPGAEMIFDTTSKLANKVVNLRAKKAGEKDVRFYFGVGNPTRIFPKWSPKIHVHNWYTIWAKTEFNPQWSEKTISAIKKSERIKAAKIIHLKF